jgi:hypothetical protein
LAGIIASRTFPAMGFSLSWIAINGMSPEKVQVALKLRGTGAREDVPDSPFAGAELPGGWYLVRSSRAIFDTSPTPISD